MSKFTEFPEETRQVYTQIYKRHQMWMKLIKNVIDQLTPKEKERLQKWVKTLKRLRSYYLKYFSYPEVSSICARCQGDCCYWNKSGCLEPIDLIYAVSINPNFQLPEPDTEFILEKVKIERAPCLFLSSQGCLLKDMRSHTCLFFFSSCPSFLEPLDVSFPPHIIQHDRFLRAKRDSIRLEYRHLEDEILSFFQEVELRYFYPREEK